MLTGVANGPFAQFDYSMLRWRETTEAMRCTHQGIQLEIVENSKVTYLYCAGEEDQMS